MSEMVMPNNDAYKTQRNTNKHKEAQTQCSVSAARTDIQTDAQTHKYTEG